MKIYGQGIFRMPYSGRAIWDFNEGPFDTTNQAYISEAKRLGLSFTPPVVEDKPKDTPKKRGRKPKEVQNVNAKINRAD